MGKYLAELAALEGNKLNELKSVKTNFFDTGAGKKFPEMYGSRNPQNPQNPSVSTLELHELARCVLDSLRLEGKGFDFGKVRSYWHAANSLTGKVMDSPALAAWARAVLEESPHEN